MYKWHVESLRIFWRNKKWFFFPFFCAVLIAFLLIFSLPKQYQASTLILVEDPPYRNPTPNILGSYFVESQISTLRQRVLSRSSLQKIVDEFGLAKAMSKANEEVVDEMRENINVETAGLDRVNAFSISYVGENPDMVMKIPNRLASLFIEEDRKFQQKRVEGVTGLIGGELEGLKKRLEGQENRIKAFEQVYRDELPEQLDANLRTLDRLQIDLQLTKEAKSTVETVIRVDPKRQRLNVLKQRLLGLQTRFKDSHPSIIELKKEIQGLEAVYKNSAKQGRSSLPSQNLSEGLVLGKEMSWLIEREKRTRQSIHLLEGNIARTSSREQERAILQRDYNHIRESYHTLLNQNVDVQISEIRIIDPAHFPESPFHPDPIKIGLLGLFAGTLLGLLLVWYRSNRDYSVSRPEDLEKLILIPVFSSILDYEAAKRNPSIFAQKVIPGLDPEKQIQMLLSSSSWGNADEVMEKGESSKQNVWTKIG
ncbi:MAG: Wzz/FepE/Etk N-terminal domain-containing protein [Nitrospirota bacterium]